jgi:hypothetical protein
MPPIARKAQRDGFTDSAAGAGDDGDAALG